MAQCFRQLGRRQYEIQAYKAALALKPDLLAALWTWPCVRRLKDFASALPYCRQAAALDRTIRRSRRNWAISTLA
jgi:tetratricopeptide (TPR) repeat protein